MDGEYVVIARRHGDLHDVGHGSENKRLRAHAAERTSVVSMKLEETRMATRYDAAFWKAQHVLDPERSTHPDLRLYWIWNEKAAFLWHTMDSNPFQSTFFAWVDIGYFRTKSYNGQHMLRTIPATLRTDQVLMLDVTALVKSNYVGGGFIGGYANGIELWYTKYYAMLDAHKQEFVGKDQPWMWKTCDANPGLCKLVVPDRKHGDPWFYMAPYMMGRSSQWTLLEQRPTITIAIPAIRDDILVNLPRLKESIDAQSSPPDEIYLVVSGVRPEECPILNGWKIVCNESLLHAGIARNIAWGHASSDLVSFIDADDEMHPERTAIIRSYFSHRPSLQLLIHGFDSAKIHGHHSFVSKGVEMDGRAVYAAALQTKGKHLWINSNFHHGHITLRKKIRCRPYSSAKRGQDAEFLRKCIETIGNRSNEIVYVPKALSRYVPRADQNN